MTRLYSYIVRYDSGFAPNPFYGFCTLATCKPDIRKGAKIGDWVVGTGSKKARQEKKLVYAMKITETLSLEEYFNDERFACKKPNLRGSKKQHGGDNIYTKIGGKWKQLDSYHSNENGSPNQQHIARDTGVNRMLISNDYVYFGGSGPQASHLEIRIGGKVKNIICKGRKHSKFIIPQHEEIIKKFEIWLRSLGETGYVGEPYDWRK